MKKGVLLLIIILLSLPIVYGVTQSFINKHNLNQANNPVVVAPSNSISFSVVRAGRTIIGSATPQVGDVLNFKYNDDVIYNFVRIIDDSVTYYKDYNNLQGSSFYGYKDWMQNYAEFSIDTAGFTPGWHHGFIYSTKFNSTTLTFSNMSWKAFSFELQSVGGVTNSTNTNCVGNGGSLGAVVPGNNQQCCAGLQPFVPPGLVGSRGTCVPITSPTSPKPDLEVLYPIFIQNGYIQIFLDEGLTTFQATIINNGNEDAVFPPQGQTGVKISYYLNNALIGEDYINDLVLKPGEEYFVESQVQYDLKNGMYDLKIKIDDNNIIDELNEANNEFEYQLYIPTWSMNARSNIKKSMPAPTAQGCIIPRNQMVVTQNAKLCPGKYNLPYGFFVDGNNFELDCNGATLNGLMNSLRGSAAISNLDSVKNIVIKNCVIENYVYGILIDGYKSSSVTIQDSKIQSTSHGIILVNNQNANNKVISNIITANSIGITLGSISNNVVMFNKIINNFVGIELGAAENNNIHSNLIESSYAGYFIPPSTETNPNPQSVKVGGYGIRMYLLSNNNIIINNRVIKNEQGGILIEDSNDNAIQDNDLGYNEDFNILLELYHSHLKIINNQISENTIHDSNEGITINAYSGDEIKDNKIFRNNMINNQRQVFDSSDYNNYWDDGKLGNYYDDYSTQCDDLDNDDICDKPLNIPGGNNKDNYPSKVLI